MGTLKNNKAIVLLSKQPHSELLEFYSVFSHLNYDVFCVCDDNNFEIQSDYGVEIVKIDEKICVLHGYVNFNPVIEKNPIVSAWEKALYFFSFLETQYKQIWFIEDDVFVPSVYPIVNVDSKYLNADIVSADNFINIRGNTNLWAWYGFIPGEVFQPPWAHSMMCAVRLSGVLLQKLRELVTEINLHTPKEPPLLFIEFVFHTLALHEGFSVVCPKELGGITWRSDWVLAEMDLFTLYHPVKQISLHPQMRDDLSKRQNG